MFPCKPPVLDTSMTMMKATALGMYSSSIVLYSIESLIPGVSTMVTFPFCSQQSLILLLIDNISVLNSPQKLILLVFLMSMKIKFDWFFTCILENGNRTSTWETKLSSVSIFSRFLRYLCNSPTLLKESSLGFGQPLWYAFTLIFSECMTLKIRPVVSKTPLAKTSCPISLLMRVLFPALVSPENAKKNLLENFILFKLNLFYHYTDFIDWVLCFIKIGLLSLIFCIMYDSGPGSWISLGFSQNLYKLFYCHVIECIEITKCCLNLSLN